jgi:signal transduction histidine kinase
MLGLTSIFAAVLAVEAVLSERYHRVVAERVLHDYAALGAEGVAQRLRAGLNGRFSTILLAAAAAPSPVSVTDLRRTLVGNARDVLDDSSRVFSVSRPDSLAATLERVTRALPGYAYFGMMWQRDASARELLVFQPLNDLRPRVMAFTLPERSVIALATRIVTTDPVLPSSITHGAKIDSGIGVRVTGGGIDLANRHFDSSSTFRASLPLEQPYGDLAVDVSLSESLAPTLIIGGLPSSRVPLLLTLLVLTLGLTAAAADQLRRERELSRLRDDFVSSVSHELRTPLAQIRMFAETLRLGRVRSTDESIRSLTIIENEARRLEHLVENVLYVSRAERRDLRIQSRPTNLTSLVQDVVTEFIPLAARSDAKIAFDLAPDIRADVDEAAVRQILLNLLDNAVKYGRAHGTITVRLAAIGQRVRLEVEDDGPGIAADERSHIWDRFWRSEGAQRSGITGTGVGLAIVRDLVTLHGGQAGEEAAASGGARFVVELPAIAQTVVG